jgi:prenyl transferase
MQRVNEIMSKFVDELGYDFANIMFNQISSGKKLRSKLILKIAGESEQSYVICAIIELIHLASLLHDDVIDNSLLRRGSPSINAKFGTKNAIMLGDILYSKGFFELSKFPHRISGTISKAVSLLSIGEMMDVELSKNFNVSHEKYKTMIYYKTAVLIEAAAEVGAILAGLDESKFKLYGKNLGLAFQIIDDILDITQDEKTLGKPNLSDFKEGKATLPYIDLFYALDDNGKKQLKSLFKKQLNSKESAWIISKMNELGIIEKSVKIAKDLGREAIEAVGDFAGLDEIVKNMIDREF